MKVRADVDVQFLSSKPMLGYGTSELRCVQPAEYLREAGHDVAVGSIDKVVPARCRVLVLHRVEMNPLTDHVIHFARLCGATVVYDTDDLTFGSGAAAPDPVQAAMLRADVVTVSTDYIRDRVRRFHGTCATMRNGLSRHFMQVASNAPARLSDTDRVRLGYFSGSSHHDADFAIIQPELIRLMQDHPNVELVLGGKLSFSDAFLGFGERFSYEAFRPYRDYISLLGKIDINLVPLDTRSDFANARSELKYIEAAAFGVPTVASPTATYRHAIANGRTGLLCEPGAWYDVLSRLTMDRSYRVRMGEAARDHVYSAYGPDVRIRDWRTFIDNLSVNRPEPSRPHFVQRCAQTGIAGRLLARSIRRRLAGHRPRLTNLLRNDTA